MTPSPKPGVGNQSRIPVKQQLSGASRTSVEEDWSEGDQAPKSARVSFKEEKDVRNIVSFNASPAQFLYMHYVPFSIYFTRWPLILKAPRKKCI